MNGHIIFQNSIRILIVFYIIHDAESLKCYSCHSGEWKRNAECESPTMSTAKADNCEKCYTIYRKDIVSGSDTVLVRDCFSKGTFMKSKYTNLKHHIVQRCSDNLCNGEIFNSHTLERLQGMDDSGNLELVENMSVIGFNPRFTKGCISHKYCRVPKTCYKCSSYNDKDCKNVNKEKTLTATDCQNKLCTTIYSKKKNALLRDCYSWKKVQYLLDNGYQDWTMSWCKENRCNALFPKCLGDRIEVVFTTGCLNLMRLQKHKQKTQIMKITQTTAAITTVVSTTTSVTEKKITVNDTSKLKPDVSALIRFTLIMLTKLFM